MIAKKAAIQKIITNFIKIQWTIEEILNINMATYFLVFAYIFIQPTASKTGEGG
jgi:hypothetical protein